MQFLAVAQYQCSVQLCNFLQVAQCQYQAVYSCQISVQYGSAMSGSLAHYHIVQQGVFLYSNCAMLCSVVQERTEQSA